MAEVNYEDCYEVLKAIMAEPAPCDNCSHYKKCKEEEVACRLFAMYAVFGKFPKDFEPIHRHPTKEIYIKIFKDDDALPKELRQAAKEAAERKNESNNGGL